MGIKSLEAERAMLLEKKKGNKDKRTREYEGADFQVGVGDSL